ncbi:MAG: hypothetical protein M3092_07190 [Actinomycetia bacterium]|nr:hypothetical protein [Actinomycetes bacterium]
MKSHGFDPLSFVFGLILLLIAGAGAWNESFRWDIGAWVLPAAVLFLGLALLVSTLRSGSKRSGVETPEAPSEAPTES